MVWYLNEWPGCGLERVWLMSGVCLTACLAVSTLSWSGQILWLQNMVWQPGWTGTRTFSTVQNIYTNADVTRIMAATPQLEMGPAEEKKICKIYSNLNKKVEICALSCRAPNVIVTGIGLPECQVSQKKKEPGYLTCLDQLVILRDAWECLKAICVKCDGD